MRGRCQETESRRRSDRLDHADVKGMLSLHDFAAAEAGGTNTDVLGGCANFGMNGAQVDVPTPLAHVVGVTNGIAELRALPADITNSCHD